MSVDNKRTLSAVVYYTLAALAILASGFFLYCLIVRDVVMWAKIIYFIWIGFVIGEIIFDIICTTTGESKTVSGMIVYVLSVLAVVMAGILYFVNTGANGLSADFFNLFISISIVSLMATGFMIATWCVGENLVEHKSAEEEIDKRQIRN